MLPPKPYRPSHKKFGLIPEKDQGATMKVPATIQTLTIFSLLAPMMGQAKGNTELADKMKDQHAENQSQAE